MEPTATDRPSPTAPSGAIDTHRYRKLRWFIAKVLLQALWWDLLLNRPGLRWLRRDPLPRWQRIARRYRALAVEMGGVLIKLGQFLSIRVDVLPLEVTRELAGLQDEVPPEPYPAIREQMEADFEGRLEAIFAEIDPEPVGAASLAQVHQARLAGGEEVVIKVLRPGIEVLVETDLAATDLALRWLGYSRRIAKRVDLERLAEEFRRTTLKELDFGSEATNARRFAELFADDAGVRVPRTFPEASARHTLTLEDVGFIKISDPPAMEAAGIDPAEVARRLYNLYMRQLFVHNFVHADPHPGNLFVEPLPTEAEREAGIEGYGPGETAPLVPERPFRLVFIDFGMTATIPKRLRGSLREYLIGLGSRDPARIVQAYQQAGVLLPGADLQRLEEIHRDLFERFWGVSLGEMRKVALSEARFFFREYRDLLVELPFQVPVDLLFATRAVGILSGLATSLDEGFDPWAETIPFAERIASEELGGWLEGLEELLRQGTLLLRLPERLERFLERAERGALPVRASLAPESRALLVRLERAGKRIAWAIVATGLGLGGVLVRGEAGPLADGLLGLALLAGLYGFLRHR